MKFSEQKPTVPGAYWFKRCKSDEPTIALIQCFEGRACTNLNGLWSSRLVPVCEVEAAWKEGWKTAGGCEWEDDEYAASRARRVVEGKETP